MSLVLGLTAGAHDAGAALFRDGALVAAVSEERLTRVKAQGGFPDRAIDAVLAMAGATRRDVEAVGCDGATIPTPGLAAAGFAAAARVEAFDHHALHGTPAGRYSGHEECAVLSLDGGGNGAAHHGAGLWRDGRLRPLRAGGAAGASAGGFYGAVTELLDFRPLRHEGKVLGLAAFGGAAGLPATLSRALRLAADGRDLESDFADPAARRAWLAEALRGHGRAEVSAAAQAVLEAAVSGLARALLRETGQRRLALGGGVFANVKLNQRLAALPEVDSLFVFPAMSNAGNAVGAGLLMSQRLRPAAAAGEPLPDVFWGPAADDREIAAELARLNLPCEKLSEEALVERAAAALDRGQVVGWFQGRMEFGPRALGHRSLLARATDPGIVRALNARLERTDFMPFAPSVLAEHAADLFEGCAKAAHAAEFMTVTFDVRAPWRARIPAAVHVDGTARPQLVRREANPRYWRLIERYRQMSGIPALLNTSFNVHEEPIVCGPREAVRALAEDRMDALAIGDFWVAPRPAPSRTGT